MDLRVSTVYILRYNYNHIGINRALAISRIIRCDGFWLLVLPDVRAGHRRHFAKAESDTRQLPPTPSSASRSSYELSDTIASS